MVLRAKMLDDILKNYESLMGRKCKLNGGQLFSRNRPTRPIGSSSRNVHVYIYMYIYICHLFISTHCHSDHMI